MIKTIIASTAAAIFFVGCKSKPKAETPPPAPPAEISEIQKEGDQAMSAPEESTAPAKKKPLKKSKTKKAAKKQ